MVLPGHMASAMRARRNPVPSMTVDAHDVDGVCGLPERDAWPEWNASEIS